LTITTAFPTGITGSVLETSEAGWAVIPSAPQGDPFDPVNSFPGNGQILIGQFATADGTAISGTMLVQYLSNGEIDHSIVSFGVPSPGALAMMGAAGLIGTRRRRRHR
jgi:MYXO-CTERM domain-containing protein